MNITPPTISSTNLDHHGLVAAVCQDLKIAANLNALLGPKHDQRVVSAGTSVVAMILNGLGFTNRRLYLTPQFFCKQARCPFTGGTDRGRFTDRSHLRPDLR